MLNRKGFTIVELLIVIVVIAILAAITIVAYNGIQNQAKNSAAQSAVSQASKKILAEAVKNADQYPASLSAAGITDSGSTTYQYTVNNSSNPRYYCITATNVDRSYYVSSTTSAPTAGGCPGHDANGEAAIVNLAHSPQANTIYASSGAGKIGWFSRWFGSGSSGTVTPITNASDGPPGTGITSYLRKQWDTIGTHTLDVGWGHTASGASSFPVTPGQTLTLSSYVRTSIAQTDSGSKRLWWTFYDSSGNSIGSNASTNAVFPAGQWVRLSATITIPANAAYLTFRQDLYLSMTAGSRLDATGVMVTEGPTLHSYADGSSPNWSWLGAPNDSQSRGLAL